MPGPEGAPDGDGGPEALLQRRAPRLVRVQHRRNAHSQDPGPAQRGDHPVHHRL